VRLKSDDRGGHDTGTSGPSKNRLLPLKSSQKVPTNIAVTSALLARKGSFRKLNETSNLVF
jgi:hypothetical protein